jgi:hypothetical protein
MAQVSGIVNEGEEALYSMESEKVQTPEEKKSEGMCGREGELRAQ